MLARSLRARSIGLLTKGLPDATGRPYGDDDRGRPGRGEPGISNGRVEAINNKIKATVRMGYAFRNTDNLVALLMLRCGDSQPPAPGSPVEGEEEGHEGSEERSVGKSERSVCIFGIVPNPCQLCGGCRKLQIDYLRIVLIHA